MHTKISNYIIKIKKLVTTCILNQIIHIIAFIYEQLKFKRSMTTDIVTKL